MAQQLPSLHDLFLPYSLPSPPPPRQTPTPEVTSWPRFTYPGPIPPPLRPGLVLRALRIRDEDSRPSVRPYDISRRPAILRPPHHHGYIEEPELNVHTRRRDDILHRDIRLIIERLDQLFHSENTSYVKFLECRGSTAQRLLDLLQDLLDYPSSLVTMNRRRIFKALIRLSGDSRLHPRCFTLTGLQLGEQVAGGAFGDVYKGTLRGETVGIKMMRVFGGKEIGTLLMDFGREALIWRQLSHPNLLPFFGLYYVEKRLCLVSPWMENGDIVAFLKREACGTDQLFSFILDVALGIEHLHEKDIVHGDLKPLNILVTPSLRACITDFGLSTTVAAMSSFQFTNSSKRARGGTVRYQAPELLRGGHNHLGSDIYAFACVAYELIAGSAPFAELRLDSAVIFKVLAGIRPSRPASLSPTRTFQGLWDLIKCCWKEQAQIRPTASRIVQALTSLDIRATTTSFNIDWDETFTSKFRRSVQVQPPLPSVSEIECMIFGEQQITALTPTVAPGELKTKAFICPLFSCGRLFKRMEHLRRHLRTHTMNSPRPFAEGEEDELGNEDVDTSMYPDNTQMRMCEVEVPGNPRDVHGDEEGLMMRVGDDLTIPHFLNPSPYVPASTFALGPPPAFASQVQTAYAATA